MHKHLNKAAQVTQNQANMVPPKEPKKFAATKTVKTYKMPEKAFKIITLQKLNEI